MATSKRGDDRGKPLDPVSIATWARIRAAGKITAPNGAERMDQNPSLKRRRRKKA